MGKFANDSLPTLARNYSAEKRARFIEAANQAFDVTECENTSVLAGMIHAGESQNAEIRARVLKHTEQLDRAKLIVAEFAKAGDFLDAEIFASGRWNNVWSFTVSDLDQIAASFNELHATGFKVPLKFGHNDEQKITDGQPALGWVTTVWRKGEKLMARFENVPAVVRKAFEAKLYRHVSVELDVDVKDHNGKKHKYVLSAVALLGADRPAVSTLADLTTYLDAPQFTASSRQVFSTIEGNRKEVEMTPEEVQAAIDKSMKPLNERITTLQGENETLKDENVKLKASQDEANKAAQGEKIKTHRASLVAKFEEAVKAGRITPAQRELGLKFMKINEDGSVLSVTPENVDEYLTVNGGKAKMSTESGRGSGSKGGEKDYTDAGAEVVRLTNEKRAQLPKLSFADARDLVLMANPELAREWMGEVDEDAA